MKHAARSAAVLVLVGLAHAAHAHVRLLVRNTNWYYTRHHCYIGVPSEGISGETGMGRGATELRVGGGDVTFAHEDVHGIWPPIAYHCPARLPGGPEVALDLTFSWLYVADGLCWTPGCRSFAQSFTAEGPELVSVRCFVASPPKPITVTLHEGGPAGTQIGSPKVFTEGTARWGLVFWEAGEAATTPGRTYTLVLRSADGTPWNPCVHSQGNCYDRGIAYFDGVPQPNTELCLLISNPSDGYLRHVPIPNDPRSEQEWSAIPNGQRFVARGRNLIFASIQAVCGGEQNASGVYLVVRGDGPEGNQVGQKMRLPHMPGKPNAVVRRGVPFGPHSVPLEPGKTYVAALEFGDGARPTTWKTRMRLYGEEAAGAHPTIASVWTGRVFSDSLEVTWRKGNRSTARIEYGRPGGRVEGVAREMGEEGWAAIGGLEPDTVYQFRLIATSPQGYHYHSPWYLARTRARDGTLGPVEPMQHFGIFDPFFLPVADAPLAAPARRASRAKGAAVAIANPGFESGTAGWTLSDNLEPTTFTKAKGVTPREGRRMFGWLRELVGKPDHELYRKDIMTQKVPVTPGTWYQLSVRAITAEPAWTSEQYVAETWGVPFFQNRCRDRVALLVDPEGGDDFEGVNSSQWYATEGSWLLLTTCFRATAESATIGMAFYQRGQRPWDAAFVDDVALIALEGPPQEP
jgi:hypothetical protein